MKISDIEIWLEEEEEKKVYSGSYWNDIEEEKNKAWWIADGNYEKLWQYLESSGLLKEWAWAEKQICSMEHKGLQVADLAAGVGWCSALLSKLENVAIVNSVDISRHRLTTLFGHAI